MPPPHIRRLVHLFASVGATDITRSLVSGLALPIILWQPPQEEEEEERRDGGRFLSLSGLSRPHPDLGSPCFMSKTRLAGYSSSSSPIDKLSKMPSLSS